MLFKKLFGKKDTNHHMERGTRFLGEERYADARHEFLEALEKADCTSGGDAVAKSEIMLKISEAENGLGLLNLSEAEHAVASGDYAKARDHLQLALELCKETALKEKAEQLLISSSSLEAPVHSKQSSHHCSGCSTNTAAVPAEEHVSLDHLSPQERFELLVQTLPGDLPRRYLDLGERFGTAYLLIHDGEEKEGATILEQLTKEAENDILLYELGVINYKNNEANICENLLLRAIAINDTNALCYLGLVQLLVDTGRTAETIPLLNHMIDRQLMPEQAMIMLGDIKQGLGNLEDSLDVYTQALTYPGAAKAAAERLIPLLQQQGRREEAAYLAKTYLKGCC